MTQAVARARPCPPSRNGLSCVEEQVRASSRLGTRLRIKLLGLIALAGVCALGKGTRAGGA